MSEYIVTRKSDGEEVYRYNSDAPIEWNGMGFSDHDHVAAPAINPDGSIEAKPVHIWSVVEYKRRFSQEERIAIRNAAGSSRELDDYLDLLKDAQDVRSDDPDVIRALTTLEAAGLIAPGRAQEILNG